jgi:hypothetical protein
MVTYKPPTFVQNPPPICPKCGNHRTEIVGVSSDRLTVVIRCNVCGERSEIKATPECPLVSQRFFEIDRFRVLNWQHT